MDKISNLTNDFILKILSSLGFKDVISTSVLSKRWRSLWKVVPKLNITEFHSQSLDLEEFWVLKSLDIKLLFINDCFWTSLFIKHWVEAAVHFGLRELRIEFLYRSMVLPNSLYTCGSLENLILCRLGLDDVPPSVCLRCLKTLHLLSVKFSSDESIQRLLSSCPVLEDLVIKRSTYVSVEIFTINVPTLRSLSIDYSRAVSQSAGVHRFEIKTTSLRYFNIIDKFSTFFQFDNTSELVKANVEIVCDQPERLLRSLTSTCHPLCVLKLQILVASYTTNNALCIFLQSQIPYHIQTCFFYLEHLELCTCSVEWWNLLNLILKYASRLRVVKLNSIHCVQYNDQLDYWNQPCFFIECFFTESLEILEWRQYKGTSREEQVAKYILAKAGHLKMATFSSKTTEKHQMFKKLKSLAICAKECQLLFN